jgi:FkbM family methyltransferase
VSVGTMHTIAVLLVGSRPKDYADRFDDARPRWSELEQRLSIIGIDADLGAVLDANEKAATRPWREHHLNRALWSTRGKQILYVTAAPSASSLFRPRDQYQQQTYSPYKLVAQVPVDTILLDDLNLRSVDFIQIDVQGGELEILRGGESTMRTVLIAIVEVSHVEVYEGQAMRQDVIAWFRSHEFSIRRIFPVDEYSRDIMFVRNGAAGEKLSTILGWFE